VESLLNSNPKLALLRDPDERLPLHWAVSYNHLPITQILLDQPKLDIDATDGSGWTPLMMSCSRPDGEATASFLLSRSADANAKNNNGQTALHFCASKGNLDLAKMLMEKGASARVKDRRGQLALHRAAAVGSTPLLKLLLEKGKSPINASDVDGMTALHHAVSEGHGDAALTLLVAGAEFDKQDSEGRLALDLAPDAKVSAAKLRDER
jgi:26S proteasome non-ATPase regulatory subunit 10